MKSRPPIFPPPTAASLPLACAVLAALLPLSAFAATWQWDGGAGDGDWQKPANWHPEAANPNYNGNFSDRLNVNGAQALIYTSAEGTTIYGASGIRGLVVGSGTSGTDSGTMTITGGTFSTLDATGSNSQDIIGNGNSNTGILNISGGTFIGASTGTSLGLGGGTGRVSTLNVNSGTATITSLIFNTSTGTINLNGGALEVNGISLSGGAGTLNLNGGTLKARATTATFVSGLSAVNVLSGGAIIDTDGKNVTITNNLLDGGGNGSLTKLSGGVLTLSGNNTYTGGTYIQGSGQVWLTSGTGAGTGTIFLQSTQSSTGTTLRIGGGITVDNDLEMDSTTGREWIRFTEGGDAVMNGNLTITGGSGNALVIENSKTAGTSATWNGAITGPTYTGSISLRNASGATSIFNGVVNIASNLDNNQTGHWIVNAAGSNYVATRIQNTGNIILGGHNGLDTSARVQWNGGNAGDLDLNGFNASVAGLDVPTTSSNPTVTNNGASDSVLTLATLEANRSFAGALTDGTTHKLTLVMDSPGRAQTLSGTNTHSGPTTVSAGTLIVGGTGSLNATSGISVAAGATFRYNSSTALTVAPDLAGGGPLNRAVLGGTGPIDVAVVLDNLGDTLAPGNSPGIQPFGTAQAWDSFSYDWEINDWTAGVAGSDHDRIAITGALDLSGASANSIRLSLLSLTALNAPGDVPGFAEIDRSWAILTTTGGINGFDAAAWQIDASGFTNPATGTWSVSQSGNDLVLSYIPEPGAALLGGLGLLALLHRRRAQAVPQ
jgi:autotransporter-associated beta strand protein